MTCAKVIRSLVGGFCDDYSVLHTRHPLARRSIRSSGWALLPVQRRTGNEKVDFRGVSPAHLGLKRHSVDEGARVQPREEASPAPCCNGRRQMRGRILLNGRASDWRLITGGIVG